MGFRFPLAALAPAVLLLASAAATAQSLSALAAEVAELAGRLAEYSGEGDAQSLLVKYALLTTGKEVAADKAKEFAAELASDGKTMNLPGHLKAINDDGEKAKRVVEAVNSNLADAPDFSHLEYCAQAQASLDQINRIESAIEDLQKLKSQAQSYKRLLVPLDKMKLALGTIFGNLMGLDVVREETTYGTLAQQWDFLTASADAGSAGDVNANYLMAHAQTNWDEVERQAGEKAHTLTDKLAARKAFHEHFYSGAAQRCSDDRARAAALASFGGAMSLPLPGMQSSPFAGARTAPDSCQAVLQQISTFLSSCMQPQSSSCATFKNTASCYARAGSQCGACPSCSGQFQTAAAQARDSAQRICAN